MEIEITKDNYESEVLKSDKPVILEFWATWWGACTSLAPSVKEVATEHPEIKVCTANADNNMDLAREFKVMSIPTVIGFKDGQVVKKVVGPSSKEMILSALN